MPQIIEEEIINLGNENERTPILNFADIITDISDNESDIYLSDSDCTVYKEDIMDYNTIIKGNLIYKNKRNIIEIIDSEDEDIEPPRQIRRQDDIEIIHISEQPIRNRLRRTTRIGTLRNGSIFWNNVNRDRSFTFTYPVNNDIILDEDDDNRDSYIPTSSDILNSIINTNRNRNNNN